MSRARFGLVAVLLASAVAACGSGDDGGESSAGSDSTPAGAVVNLENVKFDPETVKIEAGETVRWVWQDGSVQHDVAGEGFKSKVQADGTFEHRFETAGTFPYICSVHPDTMTGTVEVS